ncbi:MAG TPA: TIGR03086 family metal-binding protein [Acidimicrobiia bacterium]|nr:TIGR03086 family metal-binding protein [Acidimicrobiia bacterium]
MTEIAERFRNVAGGFTRRVLAVAPEAWSQPSPCDGWDARDVVRHLIEWVPPFLRSGSDVDLPAGPSADVNPIEAWRVFAAGVQAVLDDPAQAGAVFAHERAGTHRLEDAIAMFVLGDVLIHTWDLARAAGLDETLDPDEVAGMLPGMEGMGDALVASGHYAPATPVAGDADPQTRLLALTGRRP